MHTPRKTFGLYQLIVFVVPPNNYYFLIFNFGGHWGVESKVTQQINAFQEGLKPGDYSFQLYLQP